MHTAPITDTRTVCVCVCVCAHAHMNVRCITKSMCKECVDMALLEDICGVER